MIAHDEGWVYSQDTLRWYI